MGSRTCRVTLRDIEGVEHAAEVTAGSLYEAIALGLRAIRDSEWAGEIPEGLNQITVSSAVKVEHTVSMKQFKQWVERPGKSPKEILERERIKKLLER